MANRSVTVKVEIALPDFFSNFPVTVNHPLGGGMSGTSGDDSAKIVHESEPQKETEDPGDLLDEPRSIGDIKEKLFSASPCDPGGGGAENLAVRSENSQQLYARAAADLNSSLGFSVHGPTENNELEHTYLEEEARAGSRTDSQSSGYEGSNVSERQIHVENRSPHDEVALRHAAIQRTTSGTSSLSSSLNTEEMRRLYDRELYISGCDTCKMLRGTSPSKESIEFWDEVEISGGDDRTKCHSKFWSYFLQKLKEKFPYEEGLNSKQTNHLLKTLLNVQGGDDGEIVLSNLMRIVRYFGPVKKDVEGKCVIIRHLTDIVRNSLVTSKVGKKTIKQSWFAGDMTRSNAEELLEKQKDKTYLVRMSQSGTDTGNFVVSVKDQNGCHHFEIEGNPVASCRSDTVNCHLQFLNHSYETLPSLVEDLKYNALRGEEDEEDVECTYICPDLPFNTVITAYKRTK